MIGALRMLAPLAWRNLWRNARRTAITLIVVAVGLWSILVLAALMQAWAISSRDASLNLLTGSGQIHAEGYLDDPTVDTRMPAPDDELTAVLDAPPVATWTSRLRVPAVIQSEYKTLPVTLVGVIPDNERQLSTLPDQIAGGRYVSGPDDDSAVLGRHLADRLNTRLGKRVILMAQASDGTLAQRSFDVVGIFAGSTTAEDEFVFTGIAASQLMLDVGDAISEISFSLSDDATLDATVEALRAAAPDLDVRSWKDLSPLAALMNDFMDAFVAVWLWIMFVLMAIGIITTQLMAVFERVREFGLLQALGMRPRLILMQVALESAMLVGIGVVVGLVAAMVTIAAFSGGIDLTAFAAGMDYFGAARIIYPSLTVAEIVEYSLIVWVLGVIVALWPARRAARANPAAAMNVGT